MIAVNTKCVTPHSLLQPYVRCFAIRQFDTKGQEFRKPMFADPEMVLSFFLKSKLFDFIGNGAEPPSFTVNKNGKPECTFEGIRTTTKGFAVFKGEMLLFCIHFKPDGFFRLFNISPKELVNELGETETIFSDLFSSVHEQMRASKNLSECIALIEQFLIMKLSTLSSRYIHSRVSKAFELLAQTNTYPIKQLASDCNMTLQTFEVHFTEQVGISPKQYFCLKRFHTAVNMKVYEPCRTWTNIAHSCDYYDQMHLIKEFREFSSLSPQNFMKIVQPPMEQFE